MDGEGMGRIVGSVAGAVIVAAAIVWVVSYLRVRETSTAKRAALSWKTVLVAVILIVLLAAARIGDAEALAAIAPG
jgi:ABC-type branched-subunit amino acid transport system permease subunit